MPGRPAQERIRPSGARVAAGGGSQSRGYCREDVFDFYGQHALAEFFGTALDAATIVAVVVEIAAFDGWVGNQFVRAAVRFDRFVEGGGFDD